MVLVDTSVWIRHLRISDGGLKTLLNAAEVMVHPFVIGELACGNLKNRSEILSLLKSLPAAPVIHNDDILYFIDRNDFMGKGMGLIDLHLLCSAQLSRVPLWTIDKRLEMAAKKLHRFFTAF